MESPALQFLVLLVASWLRRRQERAVAYLIEENRVLREQLTGRRLRLTDGQRRRLAMKGRALGRKGLTEIATVVTPATLSGLVRYFVLFVIDLKTRRVRSWESLPSPMGNG